MSDSAEEKMGTDRATYPMVLSSGSLQGSGDKMLPCASSWRVHKEATGTWAGAWAMGLAEAAAGVDRVIQQQCYARSSQIIDGPGVRAGLR